MAITLRIVARERLTTLMITHSIHSAQATGVRTIMLEAGAIILDIAGEAR